MNSFEAKTLEAFLRAISQMEKPLPEDLQQEIRRVGYALEKHEHNIISEIPAIAKRDDILNKRYEEAYRSLQKQYQAQERTKSLVITVNDSVLPDPEDQIAEILNADDILGAVQGFIYRLDSKLASYSSPTNFWERGDRIIALASGGAFLGVLLAQFPGAIIGGLLAATYAWLSSSHARSDGKA